MSVDYLREFIANYRQENLPKDFPRFNVGDTINVHIKIQEKVSNKKADKDRIQQFKGVIIKKNNTNSNAESFTVRRVSKGIGVERTFPLLSPFLVKVEVLRRGKVRRAKLYYLRAKIGKHAKIKEKKNYIEKQNIEIVAIQSALNKEVELGTMHNTDGDGSLGEMVNINASSPKVVEEKLLDATQSADKKETANEEKVMESVQNTNEKDVISQEKKIKNTGKKRNISSVFSGNTQQILIKKLIAQDQLILAVKKSPDKGQGENRTIHGGWLQRNGQPYNNTNDYARKLPVLTEKALSQEIIYLLLVYWNSDYHPGITSVDLREMDLRKAQDKILLPAALQFFSNEYNKHANLGEYKNYWTPESYFRLVIDCYIKIEDRINEDRKADLTRNKEFRYLFDNSLNFVKRIEEKKR